MRDGLETFKMKINVTLSILVKEAREERWASTVLPATFSWLWNTPHMSKYFGCKGVGPVECWWKKVNRQWRFVLIQQCKAHARGIAALKKLLLKQVHCWQFQQEHQLQKNNVIGCCLKCSLNKQQSQVNTCFKPAFKNIDLC